MRTNYKKNESKKSGTSKQTRIIAIAIEIIIIKLLLREYYCYLYNRSHTQVGKYIWTPYMHIKRIN